MSATALLGACSDDEKDPAPTSDGTAECEELGSICHESDDGMGLANECHELGHANDGAVCLERYDECKTFCLAQGQGGAGQGGDGGESHHGNTAGAGGESHADAGGAGGESHGGGVGGA